MQGMSRQYFGTDGIRGVAGEEPMTAAFAFRVGVAATEALRATGINKPIFFIGTDTRRSGQMLSQALSAGMMSRGADATFLGIIPTPGVSYLTRTLNAHAGVVISASHNPFEDNGIKFFNSKGEKLSDDVEKVIEGWLEQEHDDFPPITGKDIGMSQRYRRDSNDYIKFLLANAPYLDGLRVGIDCANGASYEIAPKLFQQIGARLDVINAHPDGLNINVQCGSTHPQALQTRVKALELDVGVTFDGDADRALLVDKKGRLVTGDHILAICAATRGDKAIVATIMSNLGVENYLLQRNVKMLRTQVGDRYVHEALQQNSLSLGGEQSGHVLFLDKAPTGDGLLTALQTLSAVRKSGKPLEVWMDEIPLYPQTLLNVRVPADKKKTLKDHPQVLEAVSKAQDVLGTKGRINLRPSGTESLIRVMVEGPDQAQIEQLAKSVAAAVETAT
jgi:phosphoglucosamine mutase